MPAPERSHRFEKAILWMATGVDRYNNFTYDEPEEILVKWSTKRRNVLDKGGNTIALDATAIVAQEITVGSRIWLGPISTIQNLTTGGGIDLLDILSPHRPFSFDDSGGSSSVELEEVMEVKIYNEVRDIRGREKARDIGMIKLSNLVVTG